MRRSVLLAMSLVSLVALDAPAQTKKSKAPYQVDFNHAQDVTQMDRAPDGKEGIYIKVRFSITLDGNKVVNVGDDYKIVIEENGHRVKEVAVPRPVISDDLSVMLALDTSGSMKEHGRMTQAREASAVFLNKLPAGAECGLILFDHEIRDRLLPVFDRKPLLQKINVVQPRGGTAYLDAASEAISMLVRGTQRGRDRAVVLVTDGIDLNSKKAMRTVIDEARKGQVRVYTIGIGEPGRFDQVSTALVLDHSGSMKPPADDTDKTPKIEALHQAGYRFIDSMSTVGRVSIIPFSSSVGTPRPFLHKKDATSLRANIGRLIPVGETALFDATYTAIGVLEADGAVGRRAVVAMTDGFDNSSRRRVEEVVDFAKTAKIPLYMLGFGRESEIDQTTMERMANSTGGKYYHAKNKDSLIEIFENLSILLHDDGIDEESLRQISKETGGQYYPAKNVGELKLIFEQVTRSIQRESHEIIFPSLNQRADGTRRDVTLKLVRQSAGKDQTVDEMTGGYYRRGLVVAEMDHFVYLVLLLMIGGLIALPGLLRNGRKFE